MLGLYFPQEEYEERWRKVEAEMNKRGYDAAVIWSRSASTHERCADVLYLTNWYSCHSGHEPEVPLWSARAHAAVIMQTGETPHLHMDEPSPRSETIATDRVDWHMNPVEGVAKELNRRGISGTVALVGSDFFGVKYMRQLEALTPEIEWAFEDDLVQKPRLIKSPLELDAFREGGETVTLGLDAMLKGLLAGKSEREAAGEAAKIVVERGGVPTIIRCSHGVDREMINFARGVPDRRQRRRAQGGRHGAGLVDGPHVQGLLARSGDGPRYAAGQPVRSAISSRPAAGSSKA